MSITARNITKSFGKHRVLDHWDEMKTKFCKVMPVDYRRVLEEQKQQNLEAPKGGTLAGALGSRQDRVRHPLGPLRRAHRTDPLECSLSHAGPQLRIGGESIDSSPQGRRVSGRSGGHPSL